MTETHYFNGNSQELLYVDVLKILKNPLENYEKLIINVSRE